MYILGSSRTRMGVKALLRKVGHPIMELVVTRRDEASLIAVEGVADVKCHEKSITMSR